jgi:hypothetical protein
MAASDHPPDVKPVFAAPSLEGARLALRALLREGSPEVRATPCCAVAIDVFTLDGVLLQRAIAHADVPAHVRAAFGEVVDRNVSRFAAAQRVDAHAGAMSGGSRGGDPYRGAGSLPTNELAGFPCGHAMAVAQDRVARLRARLREASDLDVHLYAVPFLLAVIARGKRPSKREEVVVMRREDGTYVFERCAAAEA